MELTLKSDSKSKLDKILALAKELGIRVEQKEEVATKPKVPKGKAVSAGLLLSDFGKAPDFPPIDEIRSKAWPSSWYEGNK